METTPQPQSPTVKDADELHTLFETEKEREWKPGENLNFNNALLGLNILQKYAGKGEAVTGCEHDELYSISTETAIDNGLTVADAQALARMGWMIFDDIFSVFA